MNKKELVSVNATNNTSDLKNAGRSTPSKKRKVVTVKSTATSDAQNKKLKTSSGDKKSGKDRKVPVTKAKSSTTAKRKSSIAKKRKSSNDTNSLSPSNSPVSPPKTQTVENSKKKEPPRVLAIDIGGTKVKMMINGELEPRKALSGPDLTPMKLLEIVESLTKDWHYDAVTIGFPGLVGSKGPLAEPGNLGPGWVGFDFAGAFQRPVKILNDAAMQAVGSYEGGRMLFLGLGTGFGSTMIVDHVILAVELGGLRWSSTKTIGELLSKRSMKKLGLRRWRTAVNEIVHSLMAAFVADYVVVGGGNAKLLKSLPAGARVGHNQTAFRGGFRVWGLDNSSSEDLELHGSWKVL